MAALRIADADIICCICGFFLFLSFFFPRLFWASNGNKAKVRVRRNLFGAKGLWTFRPTPMGRNVYGRIVYGANHLYGRFAPCPWGEMSSAGRNVHGAKSPDTFSADLLA